MFIWIIFMINYASVIEAIVCIVYEMFYIYTPFGINMKCAYDYLQKKTLQMHLKQSRESQT